MSQSVRPLKVAIVEDNATARSNLRSHLMSLDNLEIASYSNGNELRNGLRLQNIDLLLMDFHLGQSKNGVEWIKDLTDKSLFNPSSGLVFVTSDSMPQTIGQILDLYPDFILIKPYTIKSLRANLKHYLAVRKETLPALQYLEQEKYKLALDYIEDKLNHLKNKRFRNDCLKLKGRILMANKDYRDAGALYASVLQKSSNVLWAHWGLIKSEFFNGNWVQCQSLLVGLLSQQLTKDKALEWLASVSIGQKKYQEAEAYLDSIKVNELSIQATRLKTLAYTMQGKHDEAKNLLERKLQSNITVRDRMNDYALELARFHIQMADSLIKKLARDNKQEDKLLKDQSLQAARVLIGRASRNNRDQQQSIQKDYMLALAHLLDGETNRAKELIEQVDGLTNITKAGPTTMIDAVRVFFGIGEEEKAKQILNQCDSVLLKQDDHIEGFICNEMIDEIELSHELKKERAMASNELGLQYYNKKDFSPALQCFYRSYTMFPGIPAFALNLLQCMADVDQTHYKTLQAKKLFDELNSLSLSDKNQRRLTEIGNKLDLVDTESSLIVVKDRNSHH